ncbi:hypothetical protein H7K45_20800 [Mycobacterium yunnanensis]|uniref:Uncharacterized protein n=1 Tax=Mycobacterium yunnanensis TaxID=368477 RepID=A0A9X2Z6C6_9MYCO|nr:hypothetical protein [Mycobacterium yunnanensis]MCV7422996.1 hypothetical protein [Mycobacterium yunnanensis]
MRIESPHGRIAVTEYRNLPEPGVTIRTVRGAHTTRKVHLTRDEAFAVIDAVADMLETTEGLDTQ